MSFWRELTKIENNDNIIVKWIDGHMYVGDEHNNTASQQTSLYQAYRFAILIHASFDYIATDKEVRQLSEKLLDLVEYEDKKIKVWEFLDDISDDFKILTNRQISIDDKRYIVSVMTDIDDYDMLCEFGSATFISKMLWDYIKGNDYKNIQKCSNPIINKIADNFLQADTYDLIEFAEALHKEASRYNNHTIEINGSLWVNSAKYEYVDKIIINYDDVDIYYKGKNIGCIARENINTLIEQNYDENIMTDLIENLIHLFDITKVGDF